MTPLRRKVLSASLSPEGDTPEYMGSTWGEIVYEGQESTGDEKKLLDTDDCETVYLNVLKKNCDSSRINERISAYF